MSQTYAPMAGTDTLTTSRTTLNNNMDALLTDFAGTAFPTTNIGVGMSCFRTDQNKTYQLTSTGPAVWVMTNNLAKTPLFNEDNLSTVANALTSLNNLQGVSVGGAQTWTAAQQAQARVNLETAPYDALAYNNILINGGCSIDQANLGAAVVSAGHTIDMWGTYYGGTMILSSQRSVSDFPAGQAASQKISVTTAEASLSASDLAMMTTAIEGTRFSRLGFGAAGAQSVTIGFWCKTHRAGTYSGSLQNAAVNRSYPFTWTQAAVDTWQYNTVTIPGDTGGAWVSWSNAPAANLNFAMACGTTYSAAAGSWAAGNYVAATGMTNGVAATTDTFQITGVSMIPGTEVGSAARSSLLQRPYAEELELCKRYFWRMGGDTLYDTEFQSGYSVATAQATFMVTYPVEMRVAPTYALSGTWVLNNCTQGSTYIGSRVASIGFTATASGAINVYNNAVGAYVKWDARM